MAHYVKCSICGKRFNRDNTPTVQLSARRYAHALCAGTLSKEEEKIEKDKEALNTYIEQLLGDSLSKVKVSKQIKEYTEELNYTYSGILKTLKYFYEIQKGPIEKANGGIGIVPYIYPEAHRYYYEQWVLKQKNKNKDVSLYVPKVKEITIQPPKREPKKKRVFTFLDKEVEGNSK